MVAAFLFILVLITSLIWLVGKIVGEILSPALSLEQRLEKYSHPTDSDYVAKMPSDVSSEVALGVRRILVDVSGVEVDEVWPETGLVDLLE